LTIPLFRDDAYLSTVEATVTAITDRGGIIFDQTCFYATSGGQPGDSGFLERADGSTIAIGTTVKSETGSEIIHCADDEAILPTLGEKLVLHIDWDRRYKLMRMHTACHLLSVVIAHPITGAAVSETDSRVDFDMSETADKDEITKQLMELVEANHPVHIRWITDEQLAANPGLVKSKNVRPPKGMEKIRLVCIGEDAVVDSQPCGGTHVSETQEVGAIHIAKIEKKGRENRRFRIRFQ